ncbi:MAG: response regulator transcription factor [Lachnospiraceae bacterium]|nr:response regulator transcription factor [Lachnospiraceae bacterium]
MNIAICDDDNLEILHLSGILKQLDDTLSVTGFATGEALLAAAKEQPIDLAFLDIRLLSGENGIEVAKRLLQIRPQTRIAFTTGSNDHAVDAFHINALHYLIKPYLPEDIAEVLRRYRVSQDSQLQDSQSILTLHIGRDIHTLPQHDIIKAESNGHHTLITMLDGTVHSVRQNFSTITSLLDRNFLIIKRGVSVNMEHIVRFNSTEILLADDTKYILRRDKRRQIREIYTAFSDGRTLSEKSEKL